MRIISRLKVISTVTLAALVVLAPVLIWSFMVLKNAKEDYALADAIRVNFIERASYMDRYFLYREIREKQQWDKSNSDSALLLSQAETRFDDVADRRVLERLRKNIADSDAIFQRIMDNTGALKTATGNHEVYEELDKRLFSQLLLRSAVVRDMATALKDSNTRRVERAYKQLTLIFGLFATLLAGVTILTALHLARLIRNRLSLLHDGAQVITDGNLGYRIEAGGSDEFAELAQSVNAMTDKLAAEIGTHTRLENALRDSEEKLQAILSAAEVAIAWANEDGAIEYANPKFVSLFGYTLEEVPNIEQWYLHAYPDAAYREKAVAEWNAKVASSLPQRGAIESMEVTVSCKNGSVRHVLLMGSWAGTRLLANFSDITERKLAEIALRESEIRYRSLIENSPMCVHEIDMNGKIASMNQSGLLMLGLAEEREVRGLPYLNAVCDADRDRIRGLLVRAYEGETSNFEFKSAGEGGQYFQSCFVPIKDGGGKVAKLMGITEDITKRKTADEALQESERRYHFLFDNNPMPMWVFEEGSLRFLVVNDRAVEHYGYTREEFGRMTLRDIRPAEEVPELERAISGTPDGKFSGEWRHKKKDGTIIHVSVNTSPMKYGDAPARIALIQDITGRIQSEKAMRELNADLDATLLAIPDLLFELDQDGKYFNVWAHDPKLLAAQKEVLLGHTVSEMLPPHAAETVMSALREAAEKGYSHRQIIRLNLPHGDSWFELSTSLKSTTDTTTKRFIMLSRDITERKIAEERLLSSEARLRAILDNVPYLIWLKDIEGRFVAVNKQFFNTTGKADIDEVLGKTDLELWPREMADKYRADDAEVISMRKQKLTEEMSLDNGEVQWVETFKAPVIDMNGHLIGTTGFAQDITARKNAEVKIRHLAHYDTLTDLPNRTLFSDRLQQALHIAKRDKAHMALMFIDLDKFKPINDELGHHVGDLLLKEVAQRMQHCMRESDTVARIGGDEFVVLLPVIEAVEDALLVAEKIREALNRPFVLVGKSLNISSSTGVAVYPGHGKDETQLMKNADIAMYHAKEGGRNKVVLYQPKWGANSPQVEK